MKNYTIEEVCTLPSKGKVYEETIVPQMHIRSMTTAEEQKRLAATDYPYKMLCEIIDDCIIEDIGISSYDMCLGDYQYLLHRLRVATYGPEYRMSVICPYCGCQTEEIVNLDDLPIIKYKKDIDKYFEFDLPQSKEHIRLRVQTPRLLDKVSEKVREYRKKFGNNGIDPTLTYTVAGLIDTINGEKPDRFQLDEWVTHLPMKDINTIISYAEKCNESIGVDTTMKITCDVCGLGHTAQMRMTQEFFRPTLDI